MSAVFTILFFRNIKRCCWFTIFYAELSTLTSFHHVFILCRYPIALFYVAEQHLFLKNLFMLIDKVKKLFPHCKFSVKVKNLKDVEIEVENSRWVINLCMGVVLSNYFVSILISRSINHQNLIKNYFDDAVRKSVNSFIAQCIAMRKSS